MYREFWKFDSFERTKKAYFVGKAVFMESGIMVANAESTPSKTVMITSCKGGVGKSSVTANLAYALAMLGKKVVAVDCDFSNRSLDLIFGCEDSVLYDISDIAAGRAEVGDVVLHDKRSENLMLCAAPLDVGHAEEIFGEKELRTALDKIKEEIKPDFVIIDTPGASVFALDAVSQCADEAFIVVSHQPTAARAAERTGLVLDKLGLSEQRLIINMFDADAVMNDVRMGVNELIDRTRTQIIGIVPSEGELSLAQEFGILCGEAESANMKKVSRAFENIALRMCGTYVPLLKKVCGERKRRELLKK